MGRRLLCMARLGEMEMRRLIAVFRVCRVE